MKKERGNKENIYDITVDELVKNYLCHCEYEKNLSKKTIKAYNIDLQ